MEITGITGNEKLKSQIIASARRRTLPHACLITGPEGAGKSALATFIAAALVCRAEQPPCMDCQDCRKVTSGIHPDVAVMDNQARFITVGEARELRKDAQIKPNEADRKVYIIRNAERLNQNAANALLKVLEEPPAGAAFVLTAQAPDLLPGTLRSRCETFTLEPPERRRSEQPEAQEFWALLQKGDETALACFAVAHEKMVREDAASFLDALRVLAVRTAAEACTRDEDGRSGKKTLTIPPDKLLALAEIFGKARVWCESNVGTGHLLASLAASCWETLSGDLAG